MLVSPHGAVSHYVAGSAKREIMSDPNGFPHLAAPIEIRGVELRNRLVFQPHFTALPHIDGMPSPDLLAYHVERAWGGVGLIVDGGMAVMEEGKMSRRFLSAWDPAVIPLYRAMTDEVHQHGAKIFGQLTHGGHTSLEKPPHIMWAPTQMPEPSSNFSTKAMDARDIARVIEGFAIAARNILEAGFDGIEVKLAHDGLLRSFASPFFNRRTDAYGGSFENRMRLPVEVIHAIKGAMPFEAPIGVRLCLHEYTAFGYELDYGLRMAERLEATGLVDYFNCDAGSFSSFWMEIPPAAVPQGFFRPLNQELKKITDLPVIAFGRIKRPDLAEHMLATGEADLIGMARQLIADPETPRKLLEGRAGEIRACIGCNDACIHQVVQEKGIRCVQNPAAGQERTLSERLLRPAAKPKHVVVVGGGPAGMKVAEIATRRDHKVTLLERADLLGGQARLAARQPLHEEFAEVTAYLEAAIDRLRVHVWINV
jgi:2,4-dienoyl-CoA reductase-like NADH-dependent reductase (Old Yellow Enzyme family)